MLEAWNYGATDRRKYGAHFMGVTELQINGSKIVDESIFIALNEKFPNKSQIEKDEEAKRHHQAMATWTTQREKNLFEQHIKPTLTPLNGIENKLITVANDLIKEYRKERESQKVAYYKTIMIVILSSLLLISILVFCIVC